MEQIDYKTKQGRISRLIKTQFEISKSIADSMVGKTLEVLTAECKDGVFYGKAQNELAVSFTGDTRVGEFTKVRITSSKNANLAGEVEK